MRIILAVLFIVLLYEGAWGDEQTGPKLRRSHPFEQSQPEPLGRGDLDVLAVGISDYANVPKLNLSAKDDKILPTSLKHSERFLRIPMSNFVDGQAKRWKWKTNLYGDLRRAGKDTPSYFFSAGAQVEIK